MRYLNMRGSSKLTMRCEKLDCFCAPFLGARKKDRREVLFAFHPALASFTEVTS